MNAPFRYFDTLVNFFTGMGGVGDRMTQSAYYYLPLTKEQIEAAYRSNWIARKVVDIPAEDSTSKWREWQADQGQIEKLEDLERRFRVRQKVREALVKARLYGGACLVIGTEDKDMGRELDVERVSKDGLQYLHVLSRHEVSNGPLIRDIASPWFGQPEYWEISNNAESARAHVHPSRVVRLMGNDQPDQLSASDPWGDSVLQCVDEAIKGCGMVIGSLAQLIGDAKLDIVKVPNLTDIVSTADGTNRLVKKFAMVNANKSIINAILLDKEEEWQRISAQYAGMPDVLQMYLLIVCGAADIPATRFLGRSPAGLNATGESDIRNYYDKIKSEQENKLTPAMETLDEVLIRSALGKRDKAIFYEWRSLWQLDEQQEADLALKKAQAVKIDAETGLVPFDALAKGRQNQLVEDGTYPGLDAALEDAELAAESPSEALLEFPSLGGGNGTQGLPMGREAAGGGAAILPFRR